MKSLYLTLLILTTISSAQESNNDVLSFENGDVLHGSLKGMSDEKTILWHSDAIAAPQSISSEKIRHLLLHKGLIASANYAYSSVTLKNGDVIPAEITSLNDKEITFSSTSIGTHKVARNAVLSISPTPLSGKLLYAGPYSPEDWEILPSLRIEKNEDPNKKAPASWRHIGTAWYHGNGTQLLCKKNILVERGSIRFTLQWTNQLNVTIGVLSDLASPPALDEKIEAIKKADPFSFNQNGFAQILGNSICITLSQYSSGNQFYTTVQRSGYFQDGSNIINRTSQTPISVTLKKQNQLNLEIRYDKLKKLIFLYMDGQYVNQWEDSTGDMLGEVNENEKKSITPAELGSNLVFYSSNGLSPLKISNVIISEWHGMKDSANSMKNENRDTVLLSNGTDRYSGKVLAIQDGKLEMQTTLTKLTIPMEQVAEVFFSGIDSDDKETPQDFIQCYFAPIGKITGKPIKGIENELEFKHESLGDIKLNLSHTFLLDFANEPNFMDAFDQKEPLNPEADN